MENNDHLFLKKVDFLFRKDGGRWHLANTHTINIQYDINTQIFVLFLQ